MRYTKTLAAAAVIAISGTTASAGGLGNVIVVNPPVETSSINSGYIVLGLIAALVAASGSF